MIFISKEKREQRKAVCDSCELKNGVRCGSCGCFLIGLQKVAAWGCPEGKWESEKVEER